MNATYKVNDRAARHMLHDASFLFSAAKYAREAGCAAFVGESMEELGKRVMCSFWGRIYTVSQFCEDDNLTLKFEQDEVLVIKEEGDEEAPSTPPSRRRFELN